MTVESTFTNHDAEPSFYTVSELNEAVAEILGLELGMVWLRAEVSSFTRAASGHFYLSLKDERAVVRAVMFRGRQSHCAFTPAVGDTVEVQARPGLYEPRGEFQLNIQVLRRAGRGSLHEQFELLKSKLQAEGLFDLAGKRTIERLPRAIGVITSLGAAALHDVLTTLARRAPQVPVFVYPCLVQGHSAPLALRQALAKANERQEVDTLLLVRGGGSIEDLWAFNDESLARDIAASAIPVIAGVGHESDTTIADFVADLRAPTPTAAAELSCISRQDMLAMVAGQVQALSQRMQRRIEISAQRLDRLSLKLVAPSQRIAARQHQVALLVQRMRHAVPDVDRLKQQTQQSAIRLGRVATQILNVRMHRVEQAHANLRALSPNAPLQRGFALVRRSSGRIVTEASALHPNEDVSIGFASGEVLARVQKIVPSSQTRVIKKD